MFQLKQFDAAAVASATAINTISEDIKQFLVKSVTAGFRALFYDGDTARSPEAVQAILDVFERPAELFDRHAAAVAFCLTQFPGCLDPADYTPPVKHVINELTGSVTISAWPADPPADQPAE